MAGPTPDDGGMASSAGNDRNRLQHWQSIYGEKDSTQVSWFESAPTFSLAMLDAIDAQPGQSVIDVGAGASRLAHALLQRGFTDLTALDIATGGLDIARRELGPDADRVTWITTDLLTWNPHRQYDIWHDRAVFHFLTDRAQQRRYVHTAFDALTPHGTLIIATFAEDGPEACSGLPVARYSPAQLAAALNDHADATLTVLEERREQHRTPWGTSQAFTWIALTRTSHPDQPDPAHHTSRLRTR